MSFNTYDTCEEERFCPHCSQKLESWIGPPETMWGLILVCNNNSCSYFLNSGETVESYGGHPNLSFRYAEDPENNFECFNLLSYCPDDLKNKEPEGGCNCG